ncbi:MAG: MGMT family protein [Candidatus Thorarchaeota archaeon]
MKFTIFETEFGQSAILYWAKGDSAKAIHILLPRSEKAIKDAIMSRFPHALNASGDEVSKLRTCIQDFFTGKPDPIPLSFVDISICSAFQLSVLMEEHAIPRGKTSSYGRIAARLESRAARAVGRALARNPFPIVVPCHRAVRSDRSLGGFQGGLEMKKRILILEGVRFSSKDKVHPDDFLG